MPFQPPVADPFTGSAPEAAKSWLLIEHPGPWPAFDPPADLPAALVRYCAEALGHGVRSQLIRRTDRGGRLGFDEPDRLSAAERAEVSAAAATGAGAAGAGAAGAGAAAAAAAGTEPDPLAWPSPAGSPVDHADRGRANGIRPHRPWDRRRMRILMAGGPIGSRWLIRLEPQALPSLLELDPARFQDPAPPLPGTVESAAMLVCTHGRREVCCAQFGRPVARALAAEFGPLVWETTHVGGDEFAANLVLLPGGEYFGRLLPSEAVGLARRALAGDLDAEHYRGTAGQLAPVQAADCLLRRTILRTEPAAARVAAGAGAAGR